MKKVRFISSLVILTLVFGIIAVAIIFTVMPQSKISNQITFVPIDKISFSVECEATWATGDNKRIFIETNEEGELTTEHWNAPDINFNEVLPESRTLMMSFKFRNTSQASENVLHITFEGIASDSKDPAKMSNERFYAEVQKNDGERTKLIYNTSSPLDDSFDLPAGQEVTFKIYYTIVLESENIQTEQNIRINISNT